MSKTTMQELIDTYASFDTLDKFNDWLCNNEQRLLSEEKEQIITAFEDGYKSCDIDEAFEINKKLASGEQYYNKTFNK